MSTIKVDTIATRTGSGNITLSNNVTSLTSSGAITGTTITATASGAPLTVNSTNSNNNKIIFQNNGSAVSHLGGISNGLVFANAAGTQLGRLDADGLKFGTDTAAVNGLDDYETGSWTPTVTLGGSSLSYSQQHGTYTKIGNFVRVQFYVALSGGTMNGSQLKIGPVPFTPISTHFTVGIGYNNSSGSAIAHPIPILFPSDTNIWYYVQNSTGVAQVTGNTLGNSLSQLFTITYQTN